MQTRKRILWLASWYPNKLEPLNGDFIERHAQAASLDNDIFVIHVIKSSQIKNGFRSEIEFRSYNEHCESRIIYYEPRFTGITWLEKLYSNYAYLKHFLKAANSYIREKGRPHCIHVHIAMRGGLPALMLKFLNKIPYIVSEQWTGLLKEARPNIDEYSWIFRYLWKLVMHHASACSAVSHWLGKAIQARFSIRYSVIPNVVNLSLFLPKPHPPDKFRFIHISTLNNQKNPKQILMSIAMLKTISNTAFEYWIFGEPDASLIQYAEELGISDRVEFKGIFLQSRLAGYMQECRCLVLYSMYETFGCVIVEANACGLPVIVSDIPTMHELVRDQVTGVFVPLNEPGKLAEKMHWMMNERSAFHAEEIRKITENSFGFAAVSRQFDELYNLIESGGRSSQKH
ncbi:MAG: glycosyltransferase [Chitinophagales bacterium]